MGQEQNTLQHALQRVREAGDFRHIIDAVPYARLLGMQGRIDGEGRILFSLPFVERNIGNIMIPALHGGVIGGFMESAALLHLMAVRESEGLPKTIDFSIDYLRTGHARDTWAGCEVVRQGKRVAQVSVSAWQDDQQQPIATARAHFLLAQDPA